MSNDQHNSQSNSTSSKKSIRRRPPPLLGPGYPLFSKSSSAPLEASIQTMPPIPPRPSNKFNTPPSQIIDNLTINIREYPREQQNLTPNRESVRSDDFYDRSSNDTYSDDSFTLFESPKPMGPKELLDYDKVDVANKRQPTRQFQQLSRSRSHSYLQSKPPYPMNDIPLDIEFVSDCSDQGDYEFFSPEVSPSKLAPYYPHSPPSNYRTSQIITQSLNTPTKIPSLDISDALVSPSLSFRKSMPIRTSKTKESYEQVNSRSSSSSPNRSDNPISHNASDGNGSPPRYRLSTRSNTSAIRRRYSTQNYSHIASNERGSRSPSPKKASSAVSSVISGRASFPNEGYSNEPMFNEYTSYEEVENDYSDGPSRWNSVDTGHSDKTEISDYNYYDDGYAETPTTNYFDYSILPELPSATATTFESASTSKRGTLNSGFSLKRFSQYSVSSNLSSISRKRKDDALPPVPLDLPQLPFSSSSLVTQHFTICDKVWSLSSIFQWCLKLRIWLHDSFIPKREFKKALIKLLVFHRRDVPLDIIGQNVDHIIGTFLRIRAIRYGYGSIIHNEQEKELSNPEEEKKKGYKEEPGVLMDENVNVNGVLTGLTNCYCPDSDHISKPNDLKLRCYSSRCHINSIIDHEIQLKNTNINEIVLGEDWASHWKLTAEDLRKFDKTISKRQSLIFDLLRYEQTFIQRAKCFFEIVGPEFIKAAHVLMGSYEIVSINNFEDDVLKPGEELIKIHQESLFEPLLRILISDGKFVTTLVDIANIYFDWSKVVKHALLKYISTVPMIEDLLKYEPIKKWVDVNVRNMKRVKELKVNGTLLFLSTFNSRYQSLPLQLSDIRKSFDSQEPEYIALTKALDGIKQLGTKVNEMKVHADNIYALKRIHKQLIWKNNVNQAYVNLGSENRMFFHRGDLVRKGDLKINSYNNHIILLDNYLFITERFKNQKTGSDNYRVIENPIPIELLIVEEKEVGSEFKPISKTLSSQAIPMSPDMEEDEIEPSSFPFKIRYGGRGKHNAFTFSTKSERERKEWIKFLTLARSNLCQRLRKTEPYKICLIANTCFAYDFGHKVSKLQVCAPFDPIYDISMDALNKLNALGFSGNIYNFNNSTNHIVFSKIKSISIFEFRGTKFYLIGLASGVYCSDMKNRWKKVVNGSDITKISTETSINLLILLGNKYLRYYPLDSIISVYYERRENLTCVSLSNEPVSFFAIGRHREITMLFYAKKKSNSSGATNFKVLIPETDNDGVFSAFKVVKRFYVQAECYGISIFNTSFAVHTNKGFEVLELDKLIPRSIPDIPFNEKKIDGYIRRPINNAYHPGIDLIKKSVHSTTIKPMGMFKLANNTEFLLVYNDCAIFTNKHGKLSRYSMLKFDFKAKSIAFVNNYLFLVCDEAIEIWSISDFVNGSNRLIQVIPGKHINMISSGNQLCFSMANPKVLGLQLVFQLQAKDVVT